MSISGKRSARERPNQGVNAAPTPDRAWIPMGQLLGLPAARASQREVLGAGMVEPFTLGCPSYWAQAGLLHKAGVAPKH
ncbi:hypothetical protein J1614_002946 [Plenodomus biglobosus]|nr:hypothetical protein J1614_002946 [Plenodomus biglobosus]